MSSVSGMRGILVAMHVTILYALRLDRHRREAKEPEMKALSSSLAVPTPFSPIRGNGAWVGLYPGNAGDKIPGTVGTIKTHPETMTSSWAREVTSTLSDSMSVGVGFEGQSVEVS